MQFQFWVAAVIVFLVDVLYLTKADESFINTPTSVNATLGSQANFRCIARCLNLYWTVDGEPATNIEVMKRNVSVSFDNAPSQQGIVGSTLHILASVENNNSVIVCRAVVLKSGGTNTITSIPAVLKVQGLLGSPTNVQVHATNESIAVQWSDPFTLNISNIEPDILTHTMYITNANTSETWKVNVIGTEFIFEMENPDPCHIFTFQVSAWNVVGEGQRSEPVEGFFLGVPYSMYYKQLSVVVVFLPNGTPDVQLKIQMSTCDCQGRRPEFFTIVLQGTYDTRQQVIQEDILFPKQEMNQITLMLPKTLSITANELYTVAVIPGNSAGNSAFNIGSVHFSTFDTQDAYVTVINSGNICASCYFAEGTTAQGCLVALGSPMSEELKNLTAFRSNNSAEFCDTLFAPQSVAIEDTYTCNIYDVEHNAEIGAQPAYSMDRIPVISPQNITFTDLCGNDEQINNMSSRDEVKIRSDQIAVYGCAAAGGLAVIMLVLLLLLASYKCKVKPLLKRGSVSKSSSKITHMHPNCAYESVTAT